MKEAPRRKKQAVKKSAIKPESAFAAPSAGRKSAKNKTVTPAEIPAGIEPPPQFDLGDSEWYLNRELTWLEFTDKMGVYRPSMQIDREEGRQLEITAIFRIPLEFGVGRGIDMPRVEMLATLLEQAG